MSSYQTTQTISQTVDEIIDEVVERELVLRASVAPIETGDDFESLIRDEAGLRMSGFGVLQQFIDDPAVEEVWVNQPNEVFIATARGHQRISVELSGQALAAIVEKMLRTSGRRLDRSAPFVDASLPDGSRLHAIIPSLTKKHWSVNIRKFGGAILNLDDLRESATVTPGEHAFLREAMRNGANMLVSGATQAGKTTLLCALLAELAREPLAFNERLVSIEETFEIRCDLPDWVALQARQPNLEGIGEVSLRRLIVEALRMRPTRIVVGEVRQAEAFDLLIALNSGLPGLCTIHANSADDAVRKLATLPLLAGSNISQEFVTPTVASCIDFVVHCAQVSAGVRRVVEIKSVHFDASSSQLITTPIRFG
ncbi:MAG: hypothetical protein RLZ28_335 [Actinomycetota bacterium]